MLPKMSLTEQSVATFWFPVVATLVRQPEAISYKLTAVEVDPFNNAPFARNVPDIDGQFCGS